LTDAGATPDPAGLIGALAAPERLRAFAAVVLGARTSDEVAAASGLPAREVGPALARLAAVGLLDRDPTGWRVRADRLVEAARALAEPAPAAAEGGANPVAEPARSAVLRAFLRDGRLTGIPAARGKRLVVLDHLAGRFEPGIRYPEREVNERLRAAHPDVAALRRYLVDEGFLSRQAGLYWRSGGSTDP
jgi:hypothetical protein